MMFLDMPKTRQTLNQRADSQQWWFFLLTERYNHHFIYEIEHSYYSGDKNPDFEIVIMPGFMPPLVAVVTAKKEHMSAAQLAGVINLYVLGGLEIDRTTVETGLENQDIICLDLDEGLVELFGRWLAESE